MMKRCLVDGYKHKADIKIEAPSQEMAQIRNCHEKLVEWQKSIDDQIKGAVDKANDKIDGMADKVGDKAGWAAGAAAAAAAAVVTKGAELAAAGTGLVAEKALKLVVVALGAAINAIDKPFAEVANDIFEAKKKDIVAMYCRIIGDEVKIENAVKLVRGDPPHNQAKEGKVGDQKSEAACVLMMQQNVTTKMQIELHKVVAEEIKKHAVTNVWDKLIETYNDAIKKIRELQNDTLNKLIGEPFQLDIDTYIVNQCIVEFYKKMHKREVEIRNDDALKKTEGALSEMPKIFHLVFSGFEDWTLAHWTDMSGDFEKLMKWALYPQGID